jgi:hypothetical protein
MKVLALVYADEDVWEALPEQEREAAYAKYRGFAERAGAKIAAGAELAPTRTATTIRVRDGEVLVSDGPFAETKEALGGFFLLDVDTLDEAAKLAAGIPAAVTGAIELRAAVEEEAAA